MKYTITQHAHDAMEKRGISLAWLERALASPQLCEPDASDQTLEHRLAVIPEHGHRVLHVIINKQVAPERVVTLFFDRNMKGRL